jgi:hypothetical protein
MDWQPEYTSLFAQKLAIVNHDNYQRLAPKITPLEKDVLYFGVAGLYLMY